MKKGPNLASAQKPDLHRFKKYDKFLTSYWTIFKK